MNIAVNALSKWTSEAPYLGHCPVLRKIGQAEHLTLATVPFSAKAKLVVKSNSPMSIVKI